jgi:hypothetical protein
VCSWISSPSFFHSFTLDFHGIRERSGHPKGSPLTEPKPCYLQKYAIRPHGLSPTAKPNRRPHSKAPLTHSTRHATSPRLARRSTSRASATITAVGCVQGPSSKETSSYDSSKSSRKSSSHLGRTLCRHQSHPRWRLPPQAGVWSRMERRTIAMLLPIAIPVYFQ